MLLVSPYLLLKHELMGSGRNLKHKIANAHPACSCSRWNYDWFVPDLAELFLSSPYLLLSLLISPLCSYGLPLPLSSRFSSHNFKLLRVHLPPSGRKGQSSLKLSLNISSHTQPSSHCVLSEFHILPCGHPRFIFSIPIFKGYLRLHFTVPVVSPNSTGLKEKLCLSGVVGTGRRLFNMQCLPRLK